MKYLFTILISCSFLALNGQIGSENAEEEKQKADKQESFRYKNAEIEESQTAIISTHYRRFNSRKQSLLYNGTKTSILKTDVNLNTIANEVAELDAQSHEYNMIQYWLNGKNLSAEKYLVDAYKIDPNDEESFDEVLEYANWKNNSELEREVAQKIKASSKYEQAIYQYSEELLRSIPNGSVLITSGEIETITGRVLQLINGKSKDITIIRKEWLESNRYTVARLNELGLNWNTTYGDLRPVLQNLIESNSGKNFYLSLTLPKSDFSYMSDRLFLTGLAYKYSTIPIDNLNQIQNNWEGIFLQKVIEKNTLENYGKKLLSNYLISGIKLYHYYISQEETKKAKNLKAKIFEMADISGHSNKVKLLL